MNYPLAGKRVLITRSESQQAPLQEILLRCGAVPVSFPVIRFVPLAVPQLSAVLAILDTFDWLIFTSVNAVQHWLSMTPQALRWPPVAVVGEATYRAVVESGRQVAYMPAEFTGEQLVLGLGDLGDKQLLLPRARKGRPEIPMQIRLQGGSVCELPLYDTVQAKPGEQAIDNLTQGVDAVTFTSPSAVRNFLELLDQIGLDRREVLQKTAVACIGPVTADEARNFGLPVAVVAATYSIPGLVACLNHYFSGKEDAND